MSNTAGSVLEVARGEIGYSRWDDPQAGTKYGRWYAALTDCSYFGMSGVPFCAMWTSWVFDQAGAKCVGVPGAYCPTMLATARAAGKVVAAKDAAPGDVVFFDWNGDGTTDHVGIVEANAGTYLQTIEGNTGNGQVLRRTRAYSTVAGVVRPDYGAEKPGWFAQDGTWRYRKDGGALAVSEWIEGADGNWYWFDADASMVTGWQFVEGSWYYFREQPGGPQGAMERNACVKYGDGWCVLGPSGRCVQGKSVSVNAAGFLDFTSA